MDMAQIRMHKFVEPTGEEHVFELGELEEAIHDIWKHGVWRLPYQLVDEYGGPLCPCSGTIVLRFARHIPRDIAVDIFEDEVDFDQVIAWAIVAHCEETEWTICWAMPIHVHEGPGELFYCGDEGVVVTAKDMSDIR